MSAILSLPNELLVEIAAAGQENRVDRDEKFRSEWVMSHVSRRFRDAIVGAPVLWTTVDVELGSDGAVEISKLYLERSRSCKIAATLRAEPRGYFRPPGLGQIMVENLSHILPHTPRIRRLDIIAPYDSTMMLESFRDVAAPSLEHLEITGNESLFNLELFSSGPPLSLNFLKLAGFIPQFPVPPWTTSLSHLELRTGSIADSDGNSFSMAIATQSPSLVRLYIDASDFGSPSNMRRVVIPSLKYLRILLHSDHGDTHLAEIVSLFETPALTQLTVDGAHGDQLWVLFDSTTLPDLTFPALTSLSLVGNDCGCDLHFRAMAIPSPPLRLFPALSSLALVHACFTAHIVEQLLGPASRPWPLLKTLTLCPSSEV
ncbi:hypothetical protein DFH09DRAFT_193222 [Mycena vulgaris]|nr:hypothetical protein DFH09DRAFT_193222 [Mycena vulgaris]